METNSLWEIFFYGLLFQTYLTLARKAIFTTENKKQIGLALWLKSLWFCCSYCKVHESNSDRTRKSSRLSVTRRLHFVRAILFSFALENVFNKRLKSVDSCSHAGMLLPHLDCFPPQAFENIFQCGDSHHPLPFTSLLPQDKTSYSSDQRGLFQCKGLREGLWAGVSGWLHCSLSSGTGQAPVVPPGLAAGKTIMLLLLLLEYTLFLKA